MRATRFPFSLEDLSEIVKIQWSQLTDTGDYLLHFRRIGVRRGYFALFVLLSLTCVVLLSLDGCSQEESGDWWSLVTSTEADSLGYDDYWIAVVPKGRNISFRARIADGQNGRLDFSRQAGGYSVIYSQGGMFRIMPAVSEVNIDRTIFLPYMLPFIGKDRLRQILVDINVDTTVVCSHIEWEGHLCTIIGDSLKADQSMDIGDGAKPNTPVRDQKPAFYFDEVTGAVVRLITVDETEAGIRLGDFRLFDHELRDGAWLPKRFETWNSRGMRSQMIRETSSERNQFLPNIFDIAEDEPNP